jgi:hypothetical protein
MESGHRQSDISFAFGRIVFPHVLHAHERGHGVLPVVDGGRYLLRCIDDLHSMLKQVGDWLPLWVADEQKEAKPDSVEAWGRSDNTSR